MAANTFPKLHNALWPGLVGKGSPDGDRPMADGENTNFTLVRYDAMCAAIAEAHAIDEVKDLRDKAAALQAYAPPR